MRRFSTRPRQDYDVWLTACRRSRTALRSPFSIQAPQCLVDLGHHAQANQGRLPGGAEQVAKNPWTDQGRAFDLDQGPVRARLRGPMKAVLPPPEWLQPGAIVKPWTR